MDLTALFVVDATLGGYFHMEGAGCCVQLSPSEVCIDVCAGDRCTVWS